MGMVVMPLGAATVTAAAPVASGRGQRVRGPACGPSARQLRVTAVSSSTSSAAADMSGGGAGAADGHAHAPQQQHPHPHVYWPSVHNAKAGYTVHVGSASTWPASTAASDAAANSAATAVAVAPARAPPQPATGLHDMSGNVVKVDYLVLGTGVAGLSYALHVAEYGSVAVVSKKASAETNTNYAQGGIAAVMDAHDSFESHIKDTLVAGAGLCDRAAVEVVVREGPQRVRELIALGASFDRDSAVADKDSNGHVRLHLGREGGHTNKRIVHAADATGREIEQTLLTKVKEHPNITLTEYHFAIELITEHHLGQYVTRLRPDVHCFGAYVLDERNGVVKTVLSKVTMLATGGAGRVYAHSTNPPIATGDGLAMAYRAKARVANMEFMQFHPTSMYHADADSFLITEAVRGEGAILWNMGGERFMPKYDPRAELAPRDIVARAIDDQMKQRGEDYVLLDISHRPADFIKQHFPNIQATCLKHGIDITKDPIPVVPAAHYQCGGVTVDLFGRTSIQGLFACGEVACTGLHGANRLASNSLLEALVFSRRAVEPSIEYVQATSWREDIPPWDDSGTEDPSEWVLVSHNREELRRVMSDYVGIVRSKLRLERALRRTKLLFEETEDFYRRSKVSTSLCELRNLIIVAYIIIRSAQQRHESRGLHYNVDYPLEIESEKRPTYL
eukprot:jgi/Chlat1/926/Chrsp108S01362